VVHIGDLLVRRRSDSIGQVKTKKWAAPQSPIPHKNKALLSSEPKVTIRVTGTEKQSIIGAFTVGMTESELQWISD
jgi:hypothetical protein